MSHDMYSSPLASRYASDYMLHLFPTTAAIRPGGGCGRRWPAPSAS